MTDARQDRIENYFGNAMSPADAAEFRRLMQTDPEFADQVARYSLGEYLLAGALSLQAAAGTLAPAPGVEGNRWSRRRVWLAPLAAAAAVVIAAGGSWLWSGREGGREGGVVARVEQASGECRISNIEHRSLKVGETIRIGDRIETGTDGAVTLAWVNQPTTVAIGAGSGFRVQGSGKAGDLEIGTLTATVAKQEAGRPFVIATPHAQATVVGTRFRLAVSGGAQDVPGRVLPSSPATRHPTPDISSWTRLDVVEGSVSFSDRSGRAVEVGPGECAVAEPGQAVAAFPAGVDGEAVAALRRPYRDGRAIFEDNFDGPPQGWLPLVAEGSAAAAQKDRLRIVASGAVVPPAQAGVVDAAVQGRPTKMLRLQSPAADGRLYGAWGRYNPKMRSYGIDLKVLREASASGGAPAAVVISGIRLPAGVSPRVLAGSEVPELPVGRTMAVRLEYTMAMEDATNAAVDALVFHDGRLRGWTRSRGPAGEFAGELLVAVADGALFVDDVAVRRRVPSRVAADLLALYRFDEGIGATLHDVSGSDQPMDLTIHKPEFVRWTGEGLAVAGPAEISSALSGRIPDAWRQSGGLTIEWWDQALLDDKTPGQWYALMDLVSRTHVFTHHQYFLEIPADAKVHPLHYVMTLATEEGRPAARLFVNGRPHSEVAGADDTTVRVLSADALKIRIPGGSSEKSRPWTGECRLLAIYGRALSPGEIWRNFEAGLSEGKAP